MIPHLKMLARCSWILLAVNPSLMAFQKISDAKVERIAPLSIDQAKAAIEVQSGFEIELVASEPLIQSPVAMAFDANGSLWVVEMVDYSEQENDALGRLSRLTDSDNDGVMDKSEIIAQGLSWPTAIATMEKRTWVAAAPVIHQFAEIPGDAQAKLKSEILLEGLGRQNVQGLANSFRWGLDGRLHLSTSSNGGQLVSKDPKRWSLPNTPLNVSGRDLVFDLANSTLSTVVGYGQHGMDFSPRGDRFVTSNSDHLQQVVAWYLPELTNSNLSKSVAWRRSVAVDGPQAEVFRISPVESWRAIRTQMRLAGISTGILEGQGRASGYFTSATGVTVYDGDQWPSTGQSTAFIADVGSNLVHRKRLVRAGVATKGERIDSQSEFLRSKDTWFRPVQFANGPDGCLYIVDMARETIEHPKSIPEPIKSQVDLTSGRELGRIWRVKASGKPIRREPNMLASYTTEQLCQTLGHPNGWHRETASQLLIERQDANAIPICRRLLASPQPLARLHALSVLSSLPNGIDRTSWLIAIEDVSEDVRLWAWIFANRSDDISAESLRSQSNRLLELMNLEQDLEVQMVMAVRSKHVIDSQADRARLFAQWLNRQDPELLGCEEMRAAIEFAIQGDLARTLWEQTDWLTALEKTKQGDSYLDAILYQMQRNGDLVSIIQTWEQKPLNDVQSRIATEALGRMIDRKFISEGSQAYEKLRGLAIKQLLPKFQSATKSGQTQLDAESQLGDTESQRTNAVRLLATLPIEQRSELLKRVLGDCPSPTIQCTVIESWVPSQPDLQKIAAEYLSQTDPLIEQAIYKSLTRNESGAKLLLDHLEQKRSNPERTPAWVWQSLRVFPIDAIKKRALQLSPTSEVPWESIATKYREVWNKPGDTQQGEIHFKKLCASCHKVMEIGVAVGPSLDSYRVRPNEAIALAVAEPSREMDPKYEQQQIRTNDGEVATGVLINSSQEQVTILTAQNQTITIKRSDIEEWKSSGKSLMPDGMLKELDPTALNDLIAFLRQVPAK